MVMALERMARGNPQTQGLMPERYPHEIVRGRLGSYEADINFPLPHTVHHGIASTPM
jgi:hypothetical protein